MKFHALITLLSILIFAYSIPLMLKNKEYTAARYRVSDNTDHWLVQYGRCKRYYMLKKKIKFKISLI